MITTTHSIDTCADCSTALRAAMVGALVFAEPDKVMRYTMYVHQTHGAQFVCDCAVCAVLLEHEREVANG